MTSSSPATCAVIRAVPFFASSSSLSGTRRHGLRRGRSARNGMLGQRIRRLRRVTLRSNHVTEDVIVADGAFRPGPIGGDTAPASSGPARRVVLAAAGAALPALLAACRGIQVLGAPPGPPSDVRSLRSAIAAEQLMVARYAAAARQLAAALPPRVSHADQVRVDAVSAVQAEHTEHLAQLRSRLVEPAGSSPSPSRTPSVQVTGGPGEILRTLEQAEQAASDRLLGELGKLPGSLAQLFASIAASEATHVPFLRAARRGR